MDKYEIKELCDFYNRFNKDVLIGLLLQYVYENDLLRQLLDGKDKEIANLQVLIIENKNDVKEMREFKIGDNDYDLTDEDARNDIKCQIENQTQLAIQELEKVKIELKNKICLMQNTEHCYSQRFISWYEMCDQINKQIKELKGE